MDWDKHSSSYAMSADGRYKVSRHPGEWDVAKREYVDIKWHVYLVLGEAPTRDAAIKLAERIDRDSAKPSSDPDAYMLREA